MPSTTATTAITSRMATNANGARLSLPPFLYLAWYAGTTARVEARRRVRLNEEDGGRCESGPRARA
jgi:hypothetical protein